MWDGFDQRKFPRLNLQCEVKLQVAGTDKVIQTSTQNVGIGGVCLLQKENLDRFSQCEISLELEKGAPHLECRGKVCWIIPHGGSGTRKKMYDTGIEFLELPPSERDRLRQFITRKVGRDPKESA